MTIYTVTAVYEGRLLFKVAYNSFSDAMIACQTLVLIARAQMKQVTLRKKENHFSTWKALNHFGICSNTSKLHENMFLA